MHRSVKLSFSKLLLIKTVFEQFYKKKASLVVGGGDSKHISSPCLANLDVMVNFVSTFCLSVILIHFITIFAFCICKHNSK